MVRPRKQGRSNLPQHLYYSKESGYRFTLVNGVRKSLGKDKAKAIQIAIEYNRVMRPDSTVDVDSLINASDVISNTHLTPLSEFADRLLERAIREEKPKPSSIKIWNNDIARFKEFFAEIPAGAVELSHVNDYLNRYHCDAGAAVQNNKVSFLSKLFSYAVDESIMTENPATLKKRQRKAPKQRQRLTIDAYKAIHAIAPPWLKTAMDLALQTTHASLEISRIKYKLQKPKAGECGCVWLKKPENGIYGTLFIHRQKVEQKEASHVAIPIGEALKSIIDKSRDQFLCPYVVHRRPERSGMSKEVDHKYQINSHYLSRNFSKYRDLAGIHKDTPKQQRPTFHEIRALAARMLSDQGIDPQARMAHTDSKSTKIYTRNHMQWTEVPHAEIKLKSL